MRVVDSPALAAVIDEFCATVAGEFCAEDVLRQLAAATVRVLAVDGAGVMIPHGEDQLRFVFATGEPGGPIEGLERLQEQLQDGPCRDSRRSQHVIDIADLEQEGAWPDYQALAMEGGLRAVTSLPLRARGQTWGVLDLYRRRPRRLDAAELAAAQTLANLATSYLVVAADRDSARRAQEQLAHRAMHDPLTGLPLRWVFLEHLGHALTRLARHPGCVGVLFVDLDGLKYVNDTYGHYAGDQLITACVQRVRAALRPTDTMARLGGDEFVILLEDIAGAEAAAAVAQRILEQLAAPYRPDGQVIQPSASLGLAVTADPAQTPDTLIAHADAAMYRAKHAGGGRYEMSDPAAYAADRADATARHQVTALRTAMREGRLELHYQPIIDLTTPPGTGPLYAVEALARWRHPDRGLLPAVEFIGLAERSGLIVELGGWVLRTALAQLGQWDRRLSEGSPRRMFVNVSVVELQQPGLADRVAGCLQQSGIAPDRLTLEITESGLFTDQHGGTAAVAALRELGCQLAIDDFGTGYSSLSRLVHIPAATLKVDGSFTRELSTSPAAAAVIAAVLLLGRNLDRTVVVEGVEDAATLNILRELGCTHAQGFHLALPGPPERLPG